MEVWCLVAYILCVLEADGGQEGYLGARTRFNGRCTGTYEREVLSPTSLLRSLYRLLLICSILHLPAIDATYDRLDRG